VEAVRYSSSENIHDQDCDGGREGKDYDYVTAQLAIIER
jgi:hypothetical protein